MKEGLKTIGNFVRNVISPTIGQRVEFLIGSRHSLEHLATEIESNQRLVNSVMNLMYHQKSLGSSAPIVVQQSGV